MIGIIGIVLAIIFLMVGSYKGLSALPLTLLASLIVIVTNVMNLWESLATLYMNGYVGTYLNYFLIFCCSSLYAHVMTESGSTLSIAYQLLGWFGKKRVILASIIIVAILTYGGVSLFVVMFAVGPILYTMFQEADLPRHLIVCRFLHLYHDLLARQPAVDKYYSLSVSGYSSDGCSCVWLHCSSGTVFDGLCILRILREKSAEEWGTLVFSEKF